MLKHTKILDKMSAKQKISLIANISCLADSEYAELGIPHVKFATLDELFDKDKSGLTPYLLARSWDTELISEVTEKIIRKHSDDANAIIVPAPKINLGAEAGLALSEDPFLATKITLAFLSAVNKCDKIGIIPDFCLTRAEVANMDIEPDQRALHDFVYAPFSTTASNGRAKAIIGSVAKNEGAYENFNRNLIRNKDDYFAPETVMLCRCRTYDDTMAALEENCIILSGIELAIQNAHDQYLTIMSAIEKGRASMLSLEEALDHKSAISDQMLDAAVEKVIDFACIINGIVPEELCAEPVQAAKQEESVNPITADVPDIAEASEVTATEGAAESSEAAEAPNTEGAAESSEAAEAPATEGAAESSEAAEAPATDSDFENNGSVAAPTPNVFESGIAAEAPTEINAVQAPATIQIPAIDEKTARQAIEKSTVLLKNKNEVLPLKRNESIAIIGDAALITRKGENASFADHFAKFVGGRVIGRERGYDLHEERSDALVASAVALAEKASAVMVFLKPHLQKGTMYHSTALPANQVALMNALSNCACNVIAVIDSDKSVDVSFHDCLDGLILAPIAGAPSASALANIVLGQSSMGGKLTTSFYTSPSKYYKKQRFYKNNGRKLISVFVGYRSYDTEGMVIDYPFGYGLRYSAIQISDERCSFGSITFTVTNTGTYATDETIQLYAGMYGSKLLRPKKELIWFKPMHLPVGARKQITLKNLNLSVYDEASQSDIVENGNYTIYVGTALNDIGATIPTKINGDDVSGEQPKMSDYLQSQTNIISDNFTLEAKRNIMTNYKNLRNAGLICLLVSVLVALMSLTTKSPMVPLISGAVILLVSIGLLFGSRNLKSRVKREEAERVEKNKEMFRNADTAATKKIEDLFLKEFKFDVSDTVALVDEAEEVYVDSSTAMLNDSMSFATAASDLKKSTAERGVTIDDNLASGVIASFASSKFIMAKSETPDAFDAFVETVAAYFGANLFTEVITEAHNPQDRLLRVVAEDGTPTATAVAKALVSAEENPNVMHLIRLKNLPASRISEYLIPYIRYLSNPQSKAEISVKGSDELYVIPQNVWFIAELERGILVENLPSYVLEYTTVLPVKCGECQPVEEKSEIVPITMTDFDFLTERCRSKHILNEDVWKKIDAIEAFTFKHSSYKIGNKLWLRMETHVSSMLSMQSEMATAVDSALASVILPTLAAVLAGKIDGDKSLLDEVERVFGEDNIPISHDMLVTKA